MSEARYKVRIPPHLFSECLETGEDRVWADDRGVIFGIKVFEDFPEPMAAAIHVPEGFEGNPWYRETRQPKYEEH